MSEPDVTIIIVSWNTRELLRDCLRSIQANAGPVAFEVIVVDNASSDGSADMIQEAFPQVHVIENRENRGFAAANNQALAIARGRYVLLLNPDTLVLDEAIARSVAFADRQERCAVVGIRTERPDGDLQPTCFRFASVLHLLIQATGFHELFPRSRLWGRERLSGWNHEEVREVDWVAGCYLLVRRRAVEEVGLLDEGYFMYGEEMDWCWRFHQHGWQVLYYPDARIVHYGGASSSQNTAAMCVEGHRSVLRFIAIREGRVAGLVARGLCVISGLPRLFYWAVRWALGPRPVRQRSRQKVRRALVLIFGR